LAEQRSHPRHRSSVPNGRQPLRRVLQDRPVAREAAIDISGKVDMISFYTDSPRLGVRNITAASVGDFLDENRRMIDRYDTKLEKAAPEKPASDDR